MPRSFPPFQRPALALVALILALLAAVPVARADYLVVSRRVSLKSGPSAASSPVLRVEPGQALPLASTQLNGNYYEVAFPSGTTTWIYRGFVSYHTGAPPASGVGGGAASGDGAPAGRLKVHILNVGQGDAILISCPDGEHQLLIDAGDNRYPGSSRSFQNALTGMQPQSDPIEVVVASHPHADHIGSMEWVLRRYRVGLYVDNGETYDTVTFRTVETAISERGVHRERVGTTTPAIDFCTRNDVTAVILRPAGFGDLRDPNDRSVVVRVDYGQDSFLFVGDSEKEEEAQLLADPLTRSRLDCDFLKVGHHGSDTSSTAAFLNAVTPDIAGVSAGLPGVGTNAGYMHPRRSTVERLLQYVRALPGTPRRIQTYDADAGRWTSAQITGALHFTPLEGELELESDGNGITFRPAP